MEQRLVYPIPSPVLMLSSRNGHVRDAYRVNDGYPEQRYASNGVDFTDARGPYVLVSNDICCL
ncbi:hypothetical protein ABT299_49275 [Spirillospora sp. NPDC000708]